MATQRVALLLLEQYQKQATGLLTVGAGLDCCAAYTDNEPSLAYEANQAASGIR